jgi:tetratricopeptide (TPR) repeat protein
MTGDVLLDEARLLSRNGRHVEALKKFQAAIELDRQCAEAWMGRGTALQALGRYQPSIEAFETAKDLAPERFKGEALYQMGNCAVRLGDRLRAIRLYDQSLEVAQSQTVWHNRGTAWFELGRFEQAAESYGRALDVAPANLATQMWRARALERLGREVPQGALNGTPREVANVWMQIGKHEYQAGDFEASLVAHDRAAAANPSLGWAWLGRGACLAGLGRPVDALMALDHAISLNDETRSLATAQRASLLHRMGKRGESVDEYRHLAEGEPRSIEECKAKAFALYSSDRYDEAIESLKTVQRLDPENAESLYIEGLCLQALGRNAESAEVLARFLELEPGHESAWFVRALCLAATGQAESALESCDRAIKLGLNSPQSMLLKGMVLRQLGRPVEAISVLEKTLERMPAWDEALYQLGLCHSECAEHQAAINAFDRVSEQAETSSLSIRALQMKGRSLEALGDSRAAQSCEATMMAYGALAEGRKEDAIQLFRAAMEADPKNAGASFRLGALLMDAGILEDAAKEMARGLELRPGNAPLWLTRGAVLGRLGRQPEELDCYKKALEADPLYAPALRNTGIALFEQNRFQESLDVYDRSLAIEDLNANALYGRGVCLSHLGRQAEAADALRRATEVAPDDADAWMDLGTCLVALKKYREALLAYRKAAELNPGKDLAKAIGELETATNDSERIRVLAMWAYWCLERADFEHAAQYFDAALEIDPQRNDFWNDRGICAEQLEGTDRAIEFFDRGLAIDPKDQKTWYNKAVSLQNLKRFEDAANAFARSIELHDAKELPPDEDLLHGHHNLGSCLLMCGKSEDGLDHLDMVLSLAREDPKRWQEEARRAASLRKMLLSQLSG